MKPIDFTQEMIRPVHEILTTDEQCVPAIFLAQSPPKLEKIDLPKDIFFSPEYHQLEVEKLWKKVWQPACREEDLPKVGDYVLYQVADLSIMVTRTAPDRIQGFYNSCLHRGTQLRVSNGHAKEFQCPFHGWRWHLDGRFAHMPCRWDFAHVEDEALRLPEVKVETWQGIVFINCDPDCEALSTYLENIPAEFAYIPFPPQERFTAVHIVKEMPANWKVTLEAFTESYHFMATHPQLLAFSGISQCDIYGRHSRSILPIGIESPFFANQLSEEQLAQKIAQIEGIDPTTVQLPEGMTARRYASEGIRQRLQETLGIDSSTLRDTDVIDVMSYFIFPNLIVTPSLGFPVLMKFLPQKNDPDRCLMEVRLMLPRLAGFDPPKAKIYELGLDDRWADVPGFEKIGLIFDQDTANLHRLQSGLKAGGQPQINLSQYQESIIRHFHQVLNQTLAR
jgi:phenylpropionate dioxygenase-like ring-hydroxylating dioxygenase large terminal subunit